MSALQITPWPWELHRYGTSYYNGPDDAGDPYVVTAPNDGVVLAVAVPDTVPQAEANANLIAAAPELYEALAYIREHNPDPVPINRRHWIRRVDAALAKARGEAA